MNRLTSRALPVFAALLLAGCVTAPKPLQGTYAPLQPADIARSGATGDMVRWGGRIVRVDPLAAQSCFEIVGVRLGPDGRPQERDQSEGRFIACRAGFYDPEVFQPGREITITGTVTGFENRKVGDYDYRYPSVAAEVVYLWPERKDVDVVVERYPAWWW
ncbi:Slp family lipoprotein [bacterium BD-1]|nr:Slp family lipoprotein [Ottowia caeni]